MLLQVVLVVDMERQTEEAEGEALQRPERTATSDAQGWVLGCMFTASRSCANSWLPAELLTQFYVPPRIGSARIDISVSPLGCPSVALPLPVLRCHS